MLVDTSTLRRFNRTWSQRTGVLETSFLGLGRPLAASRLLFEIGSAEPTTLRQLRDRLDLDSGYLSRLLRRLEREGLVRLEEDAHDRRRRTPVLTAAGEAALADLEDRSERVARELLGGLGERQRARLDEALRTADLLVRAATVRIQRRTSADPLVITAVERYFAELDARFPGGFDPGEPDAAIDPEGHYLLALSDGAPVAVGGVRRLAERPGDAEVKRMWVDPTWRGAGLGGRLLGALEDLARDLGHDRVLLDTNLTLGEAVAMYRRQGYVEIERYNDNPYAEAFFAKDL
jgi:DNA-binding MarR family transcriptional regulator/GNAT superfamily N-acetyltransferase